MHRILKYFFVAASSLTLLFSVTRAGQAQAPITETPQAAIQPPTPTEIIDAINALRLSHGLPTLAIHPVLMTLAQRQADGIAAGLTGHWRPYGLTLGQLLIMEGYTLAGDLTQDGYRSENWIISMTAQGAIDAWLSDDEHSNTMLSEFRSDIGAGVSMMRDEWGQDQIYVVIETALQTRSGQQQSWARDFICNDADLFILKRAGHFLAVTCDNVDGILVIQKTDDCNDLRWFDVQLGSDLFSVGHAGDLSCVKLGRPFHKKQKDYFVNLLLQMIICKSDTYLAYERHD
jgi:uncharacterized protein YkwD